MRVILICLLITGLVLGLGISCYQYLEQETKNMLAETSQLEHSITASHWLDAEKNLAQMHSSWRKKEKTLTLLINHREVDNIELTIGRLESYVKSRSKVLALGEVSALEHWIKHIPEKEAVTLTNIF